MSVAGGRALVSPESRERWRLRFDPRYIILLLDLYTTNCLGEFRYPERSLVIKWDFVAALSKYSAHKSQLLTPFATLTHCPDSSFLPAIYTNHGW